MSRRLLTSLGLVGAAGAGYYFYNAGGDPKVAQKMAERMYAHFSFESCFLNLAQVMPLLPRIRSKVGSRALERKHKRKARSGLQEPERVLTILYAFEVEQL